MRTIVKVQVPLFTNAPEVLAMIYAENRVNMTQQQLTKDVIAALGNDLKGYFEAEYFAVRRRWSIGKRVEDQAW